MNRGRCTDIIRRRFSLESPPPGIARIPISAAASKADQNPIKGPKEKGKNALSPDCAPALAQTHCHDLRTHAHPSASSSHAIGVPRVPLVWWKRV